MNPRYELVEGAAARLADRLRDAGLGDRASLAGVAETSLGGSDAPSYWDADPGWLEEGPTTRSLVACLALAAQRSPRVLVRPESDPGRHYWAGDGEPPDDVPPLGI